MIQKILGILDREKFTIFDHPTGNNMSSHGIEFLEIIFCSLCQPFHLSQGLKLLGELEDLPSQGISYYNYTHFR